MDYDAVVVGAGPAGSTLARLLAGSGARVLLLDRDAFLAEQAVATGAQFHDGELVRAVEVAGREITVRTEKAAYSARALAGADGANGIVGRSTGTAPRVDLGVALEGNIPLSRGLPQRWQGTVALDLGGLPGGYGWVFPKADHLNVGVGAWRWFAPHLRGRLATICRRYGFSPEALRDVRGHHLALRRSGAPIARGPVLTVGDAAGLVDPLAGEGIHTAFRSAGLAAQAIEAYLAERAADLSPYQAAVDELMTPELVASQKLQDIFHCAPGPYTFALQHSRRFWQLSCRIIRGELTYLDLLEMVGPLRLLVDAWDMVARKSRYPSGRVPSTPA